MTSAIITEEMRFRQRLCEYAKKGVNSKNDCEKSSKRKLQTRKTILKRQLKRKGILLNE